MFKATSDCRPFTTVEIHSFLSLMQQGPWKLEEHLQSCGFTEFGIGQIFSFLLHQTYFLANN